MVGWLRWRELFRQSQLFQRTRAEFSEPLMFWIDDEAGRFQSDDAQKWFTAVWPEKDTSGDDFVHERQFGNTKLEFDQFPSSYFKYIFANWFDPDSPEFRCWSHCIRRTRIDEEICVVGFR